MFVCMKGFFVTLIQKVPTVLPETDDLYQKLQFTRRGGGIDAA